MPVRRARRGAYGISFSFWSDEQHGRGRTADGVIAIAQAIAEIRPHGVDAAEAEFRQGQVH